MTSTTCFTMRSSESIGCAFAHSSFALDLHECEVQRQVSRGSREGCRAHQSKSARPHLPASSALNIPE